MKTLLLAIAMLVTLTTTAQSEKYIKTMGSNLAKIQTAKTDAEIIDLCNTFERIGKAEKSEWLPYYYAAMLQITRTYKMKGEQVVNIDAVLDKADELLAAAEVISPNNTEILCLKSMIYSSKISVDPQSRGGQYSQQSTEALKQAINADANNPRAYLLLAQNTFYTPAFWGGGKDKAKPIAEKSIELFESFKPASELAPNWGKEMAQRLLEQCK